QMETVLHFDAGETRSSVRTNVDCGSGAVRGFAGARNEIGLGVGLENVVAGRQKRNRHGEEFRKSGGCEPPVHRPLLDKCQRHAGDRPLRLHLPRPACRMHEPGRLGNTARSTWRLLLPLHIVVPPGTEVHCEQIWDGGQSEHPGRTKAPRPIRALKQKPKHSSTFCDPACRHSRSELLPSYAKHFAMRRLQVAYKWTGKSISLLMSQSFAVTVTLDIFFEGR